jgi:hypothetical protein
MLAIKRVATTRQVLTINKRGFYFNTIAEDAKNFPLLDFPMNLGYNDNFGNY